MRSKLMVALVTIGIIAAGTVAAASLGPIMSSASSPTQAAQSETAQTATAPAPTATTPVATESPSEASSPSETPEPAPEGSPQRTTREPPTPAATPAAEKTAPARPASQRIDWRDSRALGTHQDGRLVDGVLLPAEGEHFFTWDRDQKTTPNARARRWGTDHLIRTVLKVLEAHAHAHPQAPRVAIGDISLRHGGDIRHHVSHENGLDIDLYYPRHDRKERPPSKVGQVDTVLAQDLVDRFVRAGAKFVFVGPRTGLEGPPDVVQPLVRHDDHLHVRFDPPG